MHHLFHRKIDRRPAYLGVALLAVLFVVAGYFTMDYYIRQLVLGAATTSATPVVKTLAPTKAVYEAQAEQAMRPFITYLISRSTPLEVGDAMTIGLVDSAQTSMLALRVPSERRDQHLQAVSLLDAWHGYLTKGTGNYDAIMSRTQKLTQDSPWLMVNVVR
jgi:hypothetical protein